MKILKVNNKGSITLEATIALPIYMFALIALMSIMQMMRAYMNIQSSVYTAGKEIALYQTAISKLTNIENDEVKNIVNTATGDTYLYNKITENISNDSSIKSYLTGKVSTLFSVIKVNGNSDDIVDLIAVYNLKPAANAFGIANYKMVSRARLHPWTGYDLSNTTEDSSEERIVYITETGTVYHLTRSCTYLDLSIFIVDSSEIESFRNAGGGKYTKCEKCGGGTGNVFITGQGDRYHSSVTCSALKRTVMAVSILEVGDRKACSRCGE